MIEKYKGYLKRNFSNGPKAKIMLTVTVAVVILLTFTVASLRKDVTINIDGKEEVLVTYNRTVEDVLQKMGVKLDPKDKVQPALEKRVSDGDTITIKKAVEVKLVVKDKEIRITTAEDTIEDVLNTERETLKLQGIEFNKGVDEITPTLETKIQKDLKIQLVKVEEEQQKAIEIIKYDTMTEEDSNLDVSVKEVRQQGVNGEKELTYKVIKKDGKEISREIVSSKVLKESVNEIIAEGTKKTFASRSGDVLEYKTLLYCEATAYYSGEVTATGMAPVYNPSGLSTIAVDPRVIPLGSLVYVEGYGKAIAADTGGAIKGNKIDVYVDSYNTAVNSWGRKYNVPVYVLAYPGQW